MIRGSTRFICFWGGRFEEGPSRGRVFARTVASGLASTRHAPLSFPPMGISQPQNLRTPPIEKLRPYGVRVSLPVGDPFRKLLGPEWHRLHWYSTPAERDAALAEMGRRHQYSRAGDKPSLVFEKVENLAQSRGL